MVAAQLIRASASVLACPGGSALCRRARAGSHYRRRRTAALAGWVAWDLGEHDKVDAYYKVTSQCATTAGTLRSEPWP